MAEDSNVKTPITADRPVPELDPVSRPYWEATKRGELLIQQCPSCGAKQYYPCALCMSCGGEPEWLKAAGTGTVHTFSIVRQTGSPPFTEMLPYVIGIIELDEGVRMQTNIIGIPVDDVHVGMPVQVEFHSLNDEASLPFFRPVDA